MVDKKHTADVMCNPNGEALEDRRRRRASMPVRVGKLHDDHDLEMARYFRSRPVEESFAAMEALRRMWYGDDYEDTYRLSRSTLRIQVRKLHDEE